MKATRILSAIVIGAFAVFSFSCKKDSPTAPDTPGPKPENPDETVVPAPVPMDTLVYAFGQEAVKDQTYYYATIWKEVREPCSLTANMTPSATPHSQTTNICTW